MRHGWACDTSFFDNLKKEGDTVVDTGYINTRTVFDRNKEYDVGIGHSIGFWHLLRSGVKCKKIIGLGAFVKFRNNQQTHEILNGMIEGVKYDPMSVLNNFYGFAGLTRYIGKNPKHIDTELLINDLRLLIDFDVSSFIPTDIPITIVFGAKDQVIDVNLNRERFSEFKNITIEVVGDADHSIGLNNSDFVDKIIKS